MKRFFNFLSVLCALLAGLTSCGNSKEADNDNIQGDEDTVSENNNDENVQDLAYGPVYHYFYKISGNVKNSEGSGLKNIKVSSKDESGNIKNTVTSDKGVFDISYDIYEYQEDLEDFSMEFTDPEKEYSEKKTEMIVKCTFFDGAFHCIKNGVEIIMEESPDNINIDDYDAAEEDNDNTDDYDNGVDSDNLLTYNGAADEKIF